MNFLSKLISRKTHLDFANDQIDGVEQQIQELQALADTHLRLAQTLQAGVDRLRTPAPSSPPAQAPTQAYVVETSAPLRSVPHAARSYPR